MQQQFQSLLCIWVDVTVVCNDKMKFRGINPFNMHSGMICDRYICTSYEKVPKYGVNGKFLFSLFAKADWWIRMLPGFQLGSPNLMSHDVILNTAYRVNLFLQQSLYRNSFPIAIHHAIYSTVFSVYARATESKYSIYLWDLAVPRKYLIWVWYDNAINLPFRGFSEFSGKQSTQTIQLSRVEW